jgi:trehalose-phosphatase
MLTAFRTDFMAEPLYDHFPHVAARVADAPQLLLLLDFDGTLTPLVDQPADARLPAETRQVLETLATRRNCQVAVISGRSLEDIKARVPVPGVILAGNHGLEIQGPDFHYTHPTALACQERIQVVATRLQSSVSGIP